MSLLNKERLFATVLMSTVTVACSANSSAPQLPDAGVRPVSNEQKIPLRELSNRVGSGVRYKVIDLGTFGGPNSGANSGSPIINQSGAVVGFADTSMPDPYYPNCFGDCYVEHASKFEGGVNNDLGALPDGYSSYTNAINGAGVTVGQSQNGLIDSLTGLPEYVPAVWRKGQVIDLGTFGGAFGIAVTLNDAGLVVGAAENTVADPYGFAPFFGLSGTTQLRAYSWRGGKIHDLGTLGTGNDAIPLWINNRSQIVGASFTNDSPNQYTGIPTIDPFLWAGGKMRDLGTLGGTIGFAGVVNNRGHVVGQSNLLGDATFHPFLWMPNRLVDLGTFGGSFGTANSLNDADKVVGWATYSGDQVFHAFLWHRGKTMLDLGTLDGAMNSFANCINARGQVVGQSVNSDGSNSRAFLWERGKMIDLNDFLPSQSQLQLVEARFINDSGEIVTEATLPNGDYHSVVVIPCEQGADCRAAAPHPIRGELRRPLRVRSTNAYGFGRFAPAFAPMRWFEPQLIQRPHAQRK